MLSFALIATQNQRWLLINSIRRGPTDWSSTFCVPIASLAQTQDRDARRSVSFVSRLRLFKIAILVALLEAVDRSEINLDETLALSPNFIVGGSGTLSNRPANSQVPVVEAAELMVAVSDNTASNLLLDRLGGVEALNRRFRAWGLQHTRLRNPLPDLEGTNTTSPGDLALLLGELERGQILTMRSRDRFFEILQTTQNNSLLPQALTEDDRIAHKTGNINSSLGDVGLVDLPNGQRYIVVVLVRRENGDPEAETVIRKVSRLARDYWSSQGEASQ